jgi:hypothetical protein
VHPEDERPHPIVRIVDVSLLIGVALVVILLVFGPRIGQSPEDQSSLLRVVASGLCLVLVFLLFQVRDLRRKVLVMDYVLDDVRFGAGTRRDRDAVDILIRALRTPDAEVRETAQRTLRKLCGKDLGKDPEVWEAWWKASRSTFTRAPSAAAAPEK